MPTKPNFNSKANVTIFKSSLYQPNAYVLLFLNIFFENCNSTSYIFFNQPVNINHFMNKIHQYILYTFVMY